MLASVFYFLIVFTIIALTHEFGHLIWAKRAGIRVYELALGFGPRIISFTKNQTRYSLNLIPILGYVKIAGEGENEEDESCPEEEKIYNKTPQQKIKTLAAGPGMNILTAFIILTLVFAVVGIPKSLSNEIGLINKNSPAEKAGLKVGDKLIAINGKTYQKMEEAIKFIHQSKNQELTLIVERNRHHLTIKATPKYNEKLKVSLLGFSPKPIYERVNPILAI
ncbi:MAG: M50 family metallopeptidase, partial [Candidatus Margulisiibacteriota bacterium]